MSKNLCLFSLLLAFFCQEVLAQKNTKRIFIGVDGLSFESFQYARKNLGLFKSFDHSAAHIAPFPSISDYSWNILVGAQEAHGPKGKIKTYEASYYDRDRNVLVSDPREYFRRLGEEHHYFSGAFEHWLNPFVEALLYIPTEELPKLELRQLKEAILEDQKNLVTVMVASNDALAHTRVDSAKFLQHLDQFLNELNDHYHGEAEIIIVSDHGQASAASPGEKLSPLVPVKAEAVLKRAGLHLAKSLHEKNDVVMPTLALSNYGTVYVGSDDAKLKLKNELRKEKWLSLGVHRMSASPFEIRVSVFDQTAEAILEVKRVNPRQYTYTYTPVKGNPLQLPTEVFGKTIDDQKAWDLTADSHFPDSLQRIAFSAFEEESQFPDIIFSLKDEFFLSSDLNSLTQMYQTHGSLGKRSSLGVLASTRAFTQAGQSIRTQDILKSVHLSPADLFKSSLPVNPSQVAKTMGQETYLGVATGSDDFSQRRLFALLNRLVQDSKYALDGTSLEDIKTAIKENLPLKNMNQKLDLQELAFLVDETVKSGKLDALKNKFQKSPNLSHTLTYGGKKAAMKIYSSLIMLEKAFSIPEETHIKDTRNLDLIKSEDPATIFRESFNELILADKIYPEKLQRLYSVDQQLMAGTTLVYVPGIYDSLFDHEIFKKGLDRLHQKLGLRVISPPVQGSCSSTSNGQVIADFLKQDLNKQKELGQAPTKYFIVGYSKGGLDSLYAMTLIPDFIRDHVNGLLTIASPLRGSIVPGKADLSPDIISMFSQHKSPKACVANEWASASISPESTVSFFKKNALSLIGLTRYYSVSFAQAADKSHLFMRATKLLARFGEPNDGVVTVKSSRFPESFGAIDLGLVEADHLAGIVASHFPQEAFFESIVTTLTKLSSFDHAKNLALNLRQRYESKFVSGVGHKETLRYLLKDVLSPLTPESAKKIQEALASTPYAVNEFNLSLKDEKLYVAIPKKSFFRLPAFSNDEDLIMLENEDALLDHLLSHFQKTGRDLLKTNSKAFPLFGRTPFVMPTNQLGFSEDLRINPRDIGKFVNGKIVLPITPSTHPQGISVVYDHASTVDFRNEYQFSFENSAPVDSDDNETSGWSTEVVGEEVWAKLASRNSSYRLTSYAMKFRPIDFPKLNLIFSVADDVKGADVLKGGSGKDDSAFQLWLTLREVNDGQRNTLSTDKDKVVIMGYYFGDEIKGKNLEVDHIYTNYFSEKNFIIATLPPSKQKLVGIGAEMMNRPLGQTHDLLADIKAAYPHLDLEKLEVVSITIQHDSNDTKGSSEARFKSMSFLPK